MGEELKSVSLCLLDNVNLADTLRLDEFEIRYFQPTELQALLGEAEASASDRLRVYAAFPWARVERPIPASQADANPDSQWTLLLQQFQLSYAHAAMRSWYPFDDLLRTLNLLKPAGGPVIARQFYCWLEPLPESDRNVDRIVYGEPAWDYAGPHSEEIRPLVHEYDLQPSDAEHFSPLRTQLAKCLAPESAPDNSHLRTAVHYFENADRKIVRDALPGPFGAIEPLMSYEAALEALLIGEKERDVQAKLPKRTAAVMQKTGQTTDRVEDFVRRVFWLRSKVAHGARPIEEIERLIVLRPDDAIPDAWGNKRSIPSGDYRNLLIRDPLSFPGFLVNLRELTRICIRFFCDRLSQGQDKTAVVASLDENN